MFQFELKNGKKVSLIGNFKVELNDYGDLILTSDNLKRKSLDSIYKDLDNNLDDFYTEKIAISEEKPQSVSFEDIKRKKDHTQLIRAKFKEFINVWDTNFAIEDTEQPDRVALLKETMPFDGKKIMDFIDFHGGITQAIIQIIDQSRFENNTEFRKYCRLIAENITQVSSIVCPPLSTKLEYPFKP